MISVLFAHRRSVYKKLEGLDVWDEDRDARLWPGGNPVVAHPPCRAWGSLAHIAKPEPGERELATTAVAWVRKWGGVLEHPSKSKLWPEAGLPSPKRGERDAWGGFSLHVDQVWWGHPAQKSTLLYCAGLEPRDVPPYSIPFVGPTHVIEANRRRRRLGGPRLPYLPKSGREHTPEAFARWLVELASRCRPPSL